MKAQTVKDIMLPIEVGIPLNPWVAPSDRLTRAVKIMIENERKRMVVLSNSRAVGVISLNDAIQALGLQSMNQGGRG